MEVTHWTAYEYWYKAPAKRSQHVNETYCNIVGRNMLRAFGHRVAICCGTLGVAGSSLKMVKFEPTTPNMSQHGGKTHATCCVGMLRSFGRGLNQSDHKHQHETVGKRGKMFGEWKSAGKQVRSAGSDRRWDKMQKQVLNWYCLPLVFV